MQWIEWIGINNWFFFIFFTAVTGSIAYIISMLVSRSFLKEKQRQEGLLKLVILSFAIPLLYILKVKQALIPVVAATSDNGVAIYTGGKIIDTTLLLNSYFRLFFAVWGLGVIFKVCVYLYKRKGLKAVISRAELADERMTDAGEEVKKKLKIKRKISFCYISGVSVPFTTGIIKPVIYIPRESYTDKDLEIVICHEMMHIRRHDLMWKKVLTCLKFIYWFNPLIYKLSDDMELVDEVCCDLEVCFNTQITTAKEYFSVIINNAEKGCLRQGGMSVSLHKGKENIMKRMMCVYNYKKVKKCSKVVSVILVLCFIVSSSVSSYAMGTIIENGYTELLYATDTSYTEEPPVEDTYVEVVYPAGYVDGITDSKEIISMKTRSYATFAIPAKTRMYTESFFVSKGQSVNITVSASPSSAAIGAGIAYNDGSRRGVTDTGVIMHTFAIEQSNAYRVYVENNTTSTITVELLFTVH